MLKKITLWGLVLTGEILKRAVILTLALMLFFLFGAFFFYIGYQFGMMDAIELLMQMEPSSGPNEYSL